MSENQSSTEPDVDAEQAMGDTLQNAWHLAETDGRTRYEYRWLSMDDNNDFQDVLCQYGRYGWDVVQLINHGHASAYAPRRSYNVLMKRPYWIEQPNE
jgi:hypothetical protein